MAYLKTVKTPKQRLFSPVRHRFPWKYIQYFCEKTACTEKNPSLLAVLPMFRCGLVDKTIILYPTIHFKRRGQADQGNSISFYADWQNESLASLDPCFACAPEKLPLLLERALKNQKQQKGRNLEGYHAFFAGATAGC